MISQNKLWSIDIRILCSSYILHCNGSPLVIAGRIWQNLENQNILDHTKQMDEFQKSSKSGFYKITYTE
jgi:hypothetical protein